MNFSPPQINGVSSRGAEAVTGLPSQVWRRRQTFALVFSFCLLPALIAIQFLSPVYLAAGAVIIGNQEPASSSASAAWIEKLGDPADLESQLLIITSRRMLRLALARPGVANAILQECESRSSLDRLLMRGRDCKALTPGSERQLDYAYGHYTVGAVGRSRVISIGYRSSIPEAAFILANALLITYLEDQRAENGQSREAAASWLLSGANKPNAAPGEASRSGPSGAASLEKFYLDLYSKASELEAERRTPSGSGRLVSLAEVPSAPYFPKKMPLLAAALTVSILLAGFVSVRQDITDGAVRRTGELEALTLVPVLATLAHAGGTPAESLPFRWPWWRAASPSRWTPPPAAGTVESQVRGLYAKLMLATQGAAHKSVLVASAMQSEGKTFTAIALARAAARSGRNVLIVDCNMMQPAATKIAGYLPKAGLAEILRGEIEPAQTVIPTSMPGLSLIGAGCLNDSDPTLLLMEGQLPSLLKWAECYDLVFLDGPAATSLPDTGILAQHCDGVLWCVKWGHTPVAAVVGALDELTRQRAKVLGLVVTMAVPGELRLYERGRFSSTSYPGGA